MGTIKTPKNRQPWFVYIVKCANKALYTGSTCAVERRIKEHNSGRGGYFTRSFRPVKLLWQEQHPDKSSALKREAQIKGWTRSKKEVLITKPLPKMLKSVTKENRHSEQDWGDATARETL